MIAAKRHNEIMSLSSPPVTPTGTTLTGACGATLLSSPLATGILQNAPQRGGRCCYLLSPVTRGGHASVHQGLQEVAFLSPLLRSTRLSQNRQFGRWVAIPSPLLQMPCLTRSYGRIRVAILSPLLPWKAYGGRFHALLVAILSPPATQDNVDSNRHVIYLTLLSSLPCYRRLSCVLF